MDDEHEVQEEMVSGRTESTSPVADENEQKLPCLPCDPNRNLHRYIMFCFLCMLSFGSYFCYTNTTSLHEAFKKINGAHYSMIDSVYLWPNVILPVIGGFLIDRVLGIRVAMVAFCILISVGQLLVSIGGFTNHFWIIIVGRFVFGLGGENLQVARSTYCAIWFNPTQLNTVFAFVFSASRLGSIIDLNFNPQLYDALNQHFQRYNNQTEYIISLSTGTTLGTTLMVGFGSCVFSLLCAIIFGVFDKRAERIVNKTQATSDSASSVRGRNSFKEKITFRDIKGFPWLIFILGIIFYVTILPFVGLISMFLITKYGLSYSHASFVGSLMYIVPTIAFPVVGILVDKIGFNLIWINSGIIIALVAHLIFAFLPNAVFIPYIAMSLIGIAYTLFACVIWPLIALIIPEYQLGTAYGIMLALQNFGVAIFNIFATMTVGERGYLFLEIIHLALLGFGLAVGIYIILWDSYSSSGGTLNMSGRSRQLLVRPVSISSPTVQ